MNNADDSPKPRRRGMTYSLGGLMMFMAVACVGFAWFGAKWGVKQKERAAVAALVKLGGTVYYDYQLDPPLDPPGPAWLRSLLGDDWSAT
ncbi:MAG: hypothetical protein N2C14_29570, partial [Planctomycetales bacterium]